MTRKNRIDIEIRPSRFPDERTLVFRSRYGGSGMITFHETANGTLAIEVYRTDPTVTVTHAPDNYDPTEPGSGEDEQETGQETGS